MEYLTKVGTTTVHVNEVILVLGKRLVNNRLTPESFSRIDQLVGYLPQHDYSHCALIFCGGKTGEQTVTEAELLHQYFSSIFFPLDSALLAQRTLIESRSTTTVENIANASGELIKSGLCQSGKPVFVRLCSSDYHIQRIIEVEQLMPEQGLLNQLKRQAEKTGLELTVSLDLTAHIIAPYPHQNEKGRVFLWIEQLTVYRIYLEGVVGGVFKRPLEQVRSPIVEIAMNCLGKLVQDPQMHGVLSRLKRLEQIIEQTTSNDSALIRPMLSEFNHLLLDLNRQFDPETCAAMVTPS